MTTTQQLTHAITEKTSRWMNAIAPEDEINVSDSERAISVIAGLGLILLGLQRHSLPSIIAIGAGAALAWRGATGHCHAYSALGINTADAEAAPARPEEYFHYGIHVEQSFTIHRPPDELFQFWRNFENLPKFMHHLESVKVIDEKRSQWVAKAPAGMRVEWDAEIINEEPNTLIAWRSLDNADVDNAGSVRFIPGRENRGTVVKVVIDYIPPAGRVGKFVAGLFGEAPEQQIRDDLLRFKQLMETAKYSTLEG